jgi:hypothetical protein
LIGKTGISNIGNSIRRKPNLHALSERGFAAFPVPVIKLKKAVQKEAVCHVFEKVNTGGVVLNAFELLTATYAAENFRLRDDWYGSVERRVAGAQPAMVVKKVLRGVQNTDYLQAITLIKTYR